MIRALVLYQRKLSYWLDRKCLPPEYSVDGNASFDSDFLSKFLRPGFTVVDVGGGKHPAISAERKAALRLRVIGFDVSVAELEAAPSGSYDSKICGDVTKFTGDGSADLVICSALLEHVADVASALRAVASMLTTRRDRTSIYSEPEFPGCSTESLDSTEFQATIAECSVSRDANCGWLSGLL